MNAFYQPLFAKDRANQSRRNGAPDMHRDETGDLSDS